MKLGVPPCLTVLLGGVIGFCMTAKVLRGLQRAGVVSLGTLGTLF